MGLAIYHGRDGGGGNGGSLIPKTISTESELVEQGGGAVGTPLAAAAGSECHNKRCRQIGLMGGGDGGDENPKQRRRLRDSSQTAIQGPAPATAEEQQLRESLRAVREAIEAAQYKRFKCLHVEPVSRLNKTTNQLELRTLSYLINRLLSLAFDLQLAELPEDEIFREAVGAVKEILLHCPQLIRPGDVGPNPKGGGTLYFAHRVQEKVIKELEEQNSELWRSIQKWLLKRLEVEREASFTLAKEATRSSNGQATCSTTGGVDGNTRGKGGEEEGGDEISAAAHVSSGGASGAPARGLLSFGTNEVLAGCFTYPGGEDSAPCGC